MTALLLVSMARRGELTIARLRDLRRLTLRELRDQLVSGLITLGALFLASLLLYSIGVFLIDAALSLYTWATLTRTRSIITFTSITLLTGISLFYFRLRYRALYGMTEALVGLSAAARFASTIDPSTRDSGFYLATLTAGVYLVVRGLDNIHHGATNESSDRVVARLAEWRRKAKIAKEARGREFVRAFREQVESTIRPALQRVGERLRSTGVNTRIEQSEERLGHDGRRESEEKISFILELGDGYEDKNYGPPYLSLRPEKYNGRVGLSKSNMVFGVGGSMGPNGSVRLDQVTEEFLEQKVLALVKEVLKKTQKASRKAAPQP